MPWLINTLLIFSSVFILSILLIKARSPEGPGFLSF